MIATIIGFILVVACAVVLFVPLFVMTSVAVGFAVSELLSDVPARGSAAEWAIFSAGALAAFGLEALLFGPAVAAAVASIFGPFVGAAAYGGYLFNKGRQR